MAGEVRELTREQGKLPSVSLMRSTTTRHVMGCSDELSGMQHLRHSSNTLQKLTASTDHIVRKADQERSER